MAFRTGRKTGIKNTGNSGVHSISRLESLTRHRDPIPVRSGDKIRFPPEPCEGLDHSQGWPRERSETSAGMDPATVESRRGPFWNLFDYAAPFSYIAHSL